MKLANHKDKPKVIDILTESFKDNPTLNYMVGTKNNQMGRIASIADYAFEYAFKRNGVFLSDNEQGAAICYKFNQKGNDFSDIVMLCKLIWSGLDWHKVYDIHQHIRQIRAQRPASGEYLYFWFFGVDPMEFPKISARELYQSIFLQSRKKQLDVYAETTIERNMKVYLRYGFEVYNKWYNPKNGLTVWFMKRPYNKPILIDKNKNRLISLQKP